MAACGPSIVMWMHRVPTLDRFRPSVWHSSTRAQRPNRAPIWPRQYRCYSNSFMSDVAGFRLPDRPARIGVEHYPAKLAHGEMKRASEVLDGSRWLEFPVTLAPGAGLFCRFWSCWSWVWYLLLVVEGEVVSVWRGWKL
jgi:hypothetical protein